MSSPPRTTLYPPPPVDFTCSPFEHCLLVKLVEGINEDLFTNVYPFWKPTAGSTLFGGILIGQAIHAVFQTVPSKFTIHSMNCSFLAATDTSQPLYYRVGRTSDKRSYLSREVKAEQLGKTVFTATCSFSLSVNGSKNGNDTVHQLEIPVAGKEQLPILDAPQTDERAFTKRIVLHEFLSNVTKDTPQTEIDPSHSYDLPIQATSKTTPSTNILSSWTRSRGAMSDSRISHLAVLASRTDAWFLNHIHEMNPTAVGENYEHVAFMATLNHSIWFHDPKVRSDEWHFMERGTTWAAAGRCLIDKKIWSRDGRLVATCVQEGALRLRTKVEVGATEQAPKESKL